MNLEIKTDPTASWLVGRNGSFMIQGVTLTPSVSNRRAIVLKGISASRGVELNGGMQITETAMDELAMSWLKHRGIPTI